MKTAIALLLVFLALAAVMTVPVEGQWGNDHTYVSNQADVAITATIVYHFSGSPGFKDRTIQPQKYDSDVYQEANCDGGEGNPVEIDLVLVGSSNGGGSVLVGCDASIVGIPSASAGNSAVDIYLSVYGHINTPTGNCLITIRP